MHVLGVLAEICRAFFTLVILDVEKYSLATCLDDASCRGKTQAMFRCGARNHRFRI